MKHHLQPHPWSEDCKSDIAALISRYNDLAAATYLLGQPNNPEVAHACSRDIRLKELKRPLEKLSFLTSPNISVSKIHYLDVQSIELYFLFFRKDPMMTMHPFFQQEAGCENHHALPY